jgi:hypothetical protein
LGEDHRRILEGFFEVDPPIRDLGGFFKEDPSSYLHQSFEFPS